MSGRRKAFVCVDPVEAFAEPKFVLEFGGKIYVTQAVSEFDPDDPDLSEDARSDIDRLRVLLDRGEQVCGTYIEPPQKMIAHWLLRKTRLTVLLKVSTFSPTY